MLFYCGALAAPGNVDEGTTVMDYLPQERARGITIRAAAITFGWQGFHINLIDTPGHVDFSGEVERSLRVMDGGVLVVDATNGIQTQTKTVWQQAEKFHVPRVIFLNKMDLHSASADLTLNQIKKFFSATPLLLQVPVFSQGYLSGCVDLIKMRVLKYTDPLGGNIEILDLDSLNSETLTIAKKAQIDLLENLSSLDDEFAEKYLSNSFTPQDILLTIRKLTVRMQGYPILCGSALKNRGVQPVLDAIINFLPSPAESPPAEGKYMKNDISRSHKDHKLCALAYKVIQNTPRGPLVYARIYSGKIKHAEALKNTSRQNKVEKVIKLLRVRSDEYVELNEANAGDVIAIGGLKEVHSGDTLINKADIEEIILPGVKMPPPVFFCSIAAEDEGKEKDLEEVLKGIIREDPSFSARFDEESGQMFVTGQGELHLEILRDRILSDYKLKTRLGEMQVAYRESVQSETELLYEIDQIDSYICLKLKISKVQNNIEVDNLEEVIHGEKFDSLLAKAYFVATENQVYRDKIEKIREQDGKREDEEDLAHISKLNESYKGKLMQGIQMALLRGPLMGYPLINLKVEIMDGIYSRSKTSMIVINKAATFSIRELMKKGGAMLYEPIMNVEFEVSDACIGEIVSDISSNRRGMILQINKSNMISNISTRVPLKEMLGYTSILRSISKGVGTMTMSFHSYEYVGKDVEHNLINK
ncbi:hypothetical protein SteCoe_6313 [Stentor coeruleus]|uniref:Tr-type G domain-containing protein n=1 Tax=Stentor coeruleus TaxID=5963 RepID=A0A1R2CQ66_9CILI|nr:hypothetical protein SteCoe_6313 [Stentor coeruleus]